MDHDHNQNFTLTIQGLDAFEKFVAIVRGENIAKLTEGAARLRRSTVALSAAEEAGGEPSADVIT